MTGYTLSNDGLFSDILQMRGYTRSMVVYLMTLSKSEVKQRKMRYDYDNDYA
jgi:hypothetical protein